MSAADQQQLQEAATEVLQLRRQLDGNSEAAEAGALAEELERRVVLSLACWRGSGAALLRPQAQF